MSDSDDFEFKPPAPFKSHRSFWDEKKTPEEMKAHMLRVLSEAFGKVDSLEEARDIALLKIQLTGGDV